MGAFDDLVPSKSAGAFDDLIPAKGQSADQVRNAMLLRQVTSGLPMGTGGMAPDVAFGAAEPLMKAVQMLAHLGGNDTAPAQTVDKAVNAAKGVYEGAAQPEAFPGAGLARGAGQSVTTAPLAVARGGAIAGGAANGGIAGVLEPVYGDTSNFWTDTAKTGAKGAALGAGIGAAAKVAGKALEGATLSDAQQTLADAKVRMTPGQIAGGVARASEDKATSVPIIGDLINARRLGGITDFNRAVYARALEPFGEEGAAVAAKADVGNNGIKQVGDYLSGKYEEALAQSVPVPVADVVPKLSSLLSMVPRAKRGDFVDTIRNEVLSKVTPVGTLPPSVAKDADSALGRLATKYSKSIVGDEQVFGDALNQARSELRAAFADANPETAPLIRAADQGWATLVQMEKAGQMAGARKDGIFTPAQFLAAVSSGGGSTRNRAMSRGEKLNQDLAQAAAQVLPSTVNDTGTAGRVAVNAAATGSLGGLAAFLEPHTLTTLAATSLPYLPVIGPAVTNLAMVARPQAMKGAGDLMSKLAPYLGLLAGSRP